MGKLRIIVTGLLLLLLGLLWTAAGAAGNPDLGKTKATARTELWGAITAGKTGSASVAIMDEGKLVYSEGFGMADRERAIPIDRNTVFNIASISKMYCATAMMLLVDEGKVDLDKPVTVYLPEFTMADERYKAITVRMLLNHSSGLPGTIFANATGYQYNPEYAASVLETLAQSRLKHAPGEMAPYCNDGFTVAQLVVARVSGQDYGEFLKQRIFEPLALTRTGLSVGWRAAEQGTVSARFYNAAGKPEPLEVLSVLASGGLSATAVDLCKFADSFAVGGKHILSERSLAEMKKSQPSAFADKLRWPPFSFGLGWDCTTIPRFKAQGIDVFGKSGGTDNYSSMLLTLPDRRISVAVIAAGPQAVAMDIAETILEAYLADKGCFVPEAATVKRPADRQPIPQELTAYDGYYSSGSALLRVKIDLKDQTMDVYAVTDGQESRVASALYNDGYFYGQGDTYYFTADNGRRYLVSRRTTYGVDSVMAEKLEPAQPPQQLRAPVDGKQWLRRNAKAFEAKGVSPTYVVTSRLLGVLPGYIDFLGPKKVESPTTAGPVIHALRDLTELQLIDKDGVTWAWVSGSLYMPADSAQALTGGEAVVRIGREGYNEWLRLPDNAVLSFVCPPKSRLIIFSNNGKPFYDTLTDSGAVYAPAGSYIEMAAEPGAAFTIKAAY